MKKFKKILKIIKYTGKFLRRFLEDMEFKVSKFKKSSEHQGDLWFNGVS